MQVMLHLMIQIVREIHYWQRELMIIWTVNLNSHCLLNFGLLLSEMRNRELFNSCTITFTYSIMIMYLACQIISAKMNPMATIGNVIQQVFCD